MRGKLLIGTVALLVAMALPGASLASAPQPATCSGGSIAGGTYGDFTVTGVCNVAFGANLQIHGDLIIADGASLDDHGAELWMHAQVHVTGDILVGKGAVLGLGWNSPQGEGSLGPDTVGGDIIANKPLALQVGQVTIGGDLISNGGGVVSLSAADSRNFPVEDNVIHGNLIVQGWHGGWFGAIRNTIDGNAIFARIVSVSNRETGPGMDTDSTEIMGSDLSAFGGPVIPQTIGGNLICHDNVPAAQVNPLDGGANNFVDGKALGECAGLTQ
jgi:hypothetical protein